MVGFGLVSRMASFGQACLKLFYYAMHINSTVNKADQERWLEKRFWIRKEVKDMWRHPDTGIGYHFNAALKLAKEDCRLDPDFEVPPAM